MFRLYLCMGFYFLCSEVYAQLQTANWYFGNNLGVTFSNNPPTVLSNGSTATVEGSAVISDASGNLLFYTDGETAFDRLGNAMPNGTSLYGAYSSTQSAIIVPDPGDTSKYYVFTAPEWDPPVPFPLAYSVVDMSLNAGFGDITIKNSALLADATEKLTAVKHSNGTDYWIIAHQYDNSNFYAYQLTAAGVMAPVVSAAGTAIYYSDFDGIGYMKVSPCGEYLALAALGTSFLELFDFNASTGVVSNPVHLGNFFSATYTGVYGVEFSPASTKLYASLMTPGIVLQYDLSAGSAAAIIASVDTIGISPSDGNGALQLAPDGKIYMVKHEDGFLASINNPEAAGAACNYVENAVNMNIPLNDCLGLPNFVTSYFCGLATGIPVHANAKSIISYPNPVTDVLHIKGAGNLFSTLVVYDSNGRQMLKKSFSSNEAINMTNWKAGIYMAVIFDHTGIIFKEKIAR